MRRCLPNLSTFIAVNLSSDHFKFLESALFAKFVHNQCNRLISQSFVNFQILFFCEFFPHFHIFKLCIVCQNFPYSSQLTCQLIICEFSNSALFTKSFHIHRNYLVIQLFVNFQIRLCSPNLPLYLQVYRDRLPFVSSSRQHTYHQIFLQAFHSRVH